MCFCNSLLSEMYWILEELFNNIYILLTRHEHKYTISFHASLFISQPAQMGPNIEVYIPTTALLYTIKY